MLNITGFIICMMNVIRKTNKEEEHDRKNTTIPTLTNENDLFNNLMQQMSLRCLNEMHFRRY